MSLTSIGDAALLREGVLVLGHLVVRGAVLLGLAAAVVRLWPRASAAQRHMVWTVACCGQLLLPVLSVIVPAWRVPVPIESPTTAPKWGTVLPTSRSSASTGVRHGAATLPADEPDRRDSVASVWLLLLLWGWGIGALTVLAVFMNARRRVRRVVADALPVMDPHMRGSIARVEAAARVSRPVSVKLHPSTIPMVYGVLWPVIVLPVSACTWSELRLRNVLLHELEHVNRYDCLVQVATSVVCALYWFNPLIWLAARALQREQEQACDDAVLAAGGKARDYATDLLELTQSFHVARVMMLVALPFARPSQLRTRVRAIVDRSRRRSVVSRWGVLGIWGAGVGVMYPVAGMAPQVTARIGHEQATPGRGRGGTQSLAPIYQTVSPPSPEDPYMTRSTITSMMTSTALAGMLVGVPVPGGAQFTAPSHHPSTVVAHDTTVPTGQATVLTGLASDTVVLNVDSINVDSIRVLKASDTVVNEQPIVIVDGVRINTKSDSTPLDHIDPKSIETIEVFKGPSATAKYGADAAGGVIVITTKGAKTSKSPAKPSVH